MRTGLRQMWKSSLTTRLLSPRGIWPRAAKSALPKWAGSCLNYKSKRRSGKTEGASLAIPRKYETTRTPWLIESVTSLMRSTWTMQ